MPCEEYQVKPLPYAYNALEPYINEETMKVHHDVLYKRYVDNLKAAIENYPQLCGLSYEQLILMSPDLPEEIATRVFNYAGGAYNHELYFEMMSPITGQRPTGSLLEAIIYNFGSYENFLDAFKEQAMAVFGSGYTWLVVNDVGSLEIINTANQVTPFSYNMYPIICIDIWEHAYFLQYQAARADYINAWAQVANWQEASRRFEGGVTSL